MTIIKCTKAITEAKFERICQSRNLEVAMHHNPSPTEIVVTLRDVETKSEVCGFEYLSNKSRFFLIVDQVVAQ